MIFWVLSILWQIKHEKVSRPSNADKNGLGEYQTRNLDTFCLAKTLFDGAATFWTLLDHPDYCEARRGCEEDIMIISCCGLL